jgi:outer membrane immunogenic protein
MKKLLNGSVVALATIGGSAAMAADMPLKAPPPPPVFSWTGCYVGIEGGYAWGRSRHRAPNFGGPLAGQIFVGGAEITDTFDVSGGTAGFEYGCNQQFGNYWVFGIEGDWSWSSKKGGTNEKFPGNPLFFARPRRSGFRPAAAASAGPGIRLSVTGGLRQPASR